MDKTQKNILQTYKIQQKLGQGGFAQVRKAKNRETGQYFAVKIYDKRNISESDLESVINEIEILKQIDHPNIINLEEVIEDEKYYFLVFEFMEGGDLYDYVEEKKMLSEIETRQIIEQIIDSLRYLHQIGIIHRDIKPQNLLFKSIEKKISSIKLSDFGLGKQLNESNFAQTICGTPSYIAPEIIFDDQYGKECDFWSLGILTFYLLSGDMPFDDDNRDVLFQKIKKCQFNFQNSVWKNISLESQDFISKLLVNDPKKRMTIEQMTQHPWILNKSHN